jgi:TPR repeat protein
MSPQNAVAYFDRSLEIDPDQYCSSCNAYAGRAEARLALGERDKALPDLIHAAEAQDNHWALRQLAGMYAFGWHGATPNPPRARPWCERAARQGDPWSMFCIAHAYRTGWGGAQRDLAKGLQWMQRAAERDIPGAQYNLGWIHWNGEDVPYDPLRAVYWWGRAALQGEPLAQGRLLELAAFAALPLFALVVCIGILVRRRRRQSVR